MRTVGVNVLLLQTRVLVTSYMGELKDGGECFSGLDPKCRSLNFGIGKEMKEKLLSSPLTQHPLASDAPMWSPSK